MTTHLNHPRRPTTVALQQLGIPDILQQALIDSPQVERKSFAYSTIGQIRRTWLNNENIWHATVRDSDGRIVREETHDGHLTQYTLDERGDTVGKMTFDNGTLTAEEVIKRNAASNPTTICQAGVAGACSWLKNNTTPPATNDFSATFYTYDAEDRLIRVQDPEGAIQVTDFDEFYRPRRQYSLNQASLPEREQHTFYDVRGRVMAIGEGAGGAQLQQFFAYDGFGQLLYRRDTLGRDWYNAYDLRDRLIATCENDPDCGPNSTLAQSPGDFVTHFSYNGFDEVVEERVNDTLVTTYARQPDGRVVTKTTTNEDPVYFAYDTDGTIVWTGQGDTQKFSVADSTHHRVFTATLDGTVASTTMSQLDPWGYTSTILRKPPAAAPNAGVADWTACVVLATLVDETVVWRKRFLELV